MFFRRRYPRKVRPPALTAKYCRKCDRYLGRDYPGIVLWCPEHPSWISYEKPGSGKE